MTSVKTIETASGRIECHPNGLIRSTPKAIEHTLVHAQADAQLCRQHAQDLDRKIRILVDIRKVTGLSRDARLLYQSEAIAAFSVGAALLIDSGISKVIGNFIIGLNKGSIHTRLFTSEDEALAWLDTLPVESLKAE